MCINVTDMEHYLSAVTHLLRMDPVIPVVSYSQVFLATHAVSHNSITALTFYSILIDSKLNKKGNTLLVTQVFYVLRTVPGQSEHLIPIC